MLLSISPIRQDIFIVNGHVYPQVDQIRTDLRYLEPKLLFLNQRNGSFKDISKSAGDAIQLPQVSRGMAVGDLFNDGKLEAVVENLKGATDDFAARRRTAKPLDQLSIGGSQKQPLGVECARARFRR